ncbi:phosphoenolpyruvate-protein phosphotransferase [Paenibacillus sp. J31TS4]|nr:phosphoenolpyruvate-protein phosphotransferase [Paenibacillus sp. J31TS4]
MQGIGVSDGIRIGPAFLYRPHGETAARTAGQPGPGEETPRLGEEEAARETKRLEAARDASVAAYDALIERAKLTVGEQQAAILVGQQRLLTDKAFYPPIAKLVAEERLPAEAAVRQVVEQVAGKFERLASDYMRERAADIRDIGGRLLGELTGEGAGQLASLTEQVILIADDLAPSDTVQLDKNVVLAFVTRKGGKTSHTAILSRSLGIAAVVGAGNALDEIQDGDLLIVDGAAGVCHVRPDEATVAEYRTRMEEEARRLEQLAAFREAPAASRDGKRIEVAVNIGTVKEAEAAADSGAEGVGLYRTEFLFMHSDHLPTEEEQADAYTQVAELWGGRPVIIRTLDIGGDKALPYLPLAKEENPFLGYRAIRIGLDRPELLRTQLRAILRASAHGKLRVMFPMISSLSEWRRAKAMLEEAKAELDREGVAFDRGIEAGIMVEIPAAAMQADSFAREVDFFSIGTNDLVQYTLAVDRMNEQIAHLYDYFHPAVLLLIRRVIVAAHRAGKWTGMCGGMAGDPLAAPLLLGFGLDEWSMDVSSINRIKETVSRLDSAECTALADRLLEEATPEDVRRELKAYVDGL